MPIFEQRDQEQARRSLSTWLARQLPGAADVLVSELGGPAATGYSNETILLDASWREGGEEHHEGFAVRVKPSSHTVFLESEFETQYPVGQCRQSIIVRDNHERLMPLARQR